MPFQREDASSSSAGGTPEEKLCVDSNSQKATAAQSANLDRALQPLFDSPASPALRMPPKITSEIFRHFLPTYPESPPLSGILSPLLFCQICVHWRKIVLSTPRLWRAIKLVLRPSPDKQFLPWLDRLTTWLARSGQSPLSLEITVMTSTSEFSLLPEFIRTIALHRHCLDHLVVDVPFEHLSFLRGEMPLLRDLTIGSIYHVPPSNRSILIDHAPKLRNLDIPMFDVAFVCLPFAQLVSLDTGYIYLAECAEILREGKNLIDCRFNICGETVTPTPVPMVPAHTRLRHLASRMADDVTPINTFLNELALPALSKLEVYECDVTIAALAAFISPLAVYLEELRITDATLEHAMYREALPSIRAIILERADTYSSGSPSPSI